MRYNHPRCQPANPKIRRYLLRPTKKKNMETGKSRSPSCKRKSHVRKAAILGGCHVHFLEVVKNLEVRRCSCPGSTRYVCFCFLGDKVEKAKMNRQAVLRMWFIYSAAYGVESFSMFLFNFNGGNRWKPWNTFRFIGDGT